MLYILGLRPPKPIKEVKVEPKADRLPRTLVCSCGTMVPVSRYRMKNDREYKCSTCRPKKEVVL